jgi:cysteinyl-tRNA synthetase
MGIKEYAAHFMDITLYNTMTRNKEKFSPIKPGEVSMYHCGPTVYDYAHIGNLRSYVFADILRRICEYNSFTVHQIINITDVGHLVSDDDEGEDKMTKALKREGKPLTIASMLEIATFYFEKFTEDLVSLNIEMPKAFPRASENIEDDIEIIKKLEIGGYIYTIKDGLYFDTACFKDYGKLGGLKDADSLVDDHKKFQSRIGWNLEKRNQRDFSVWKFDQKLGWESPWGKGFPGWHIECSVMARKYLEQPFDIHTGGIDHIAVHHNNEIAQSEAAYSMELSRFWMHNEFITFNNTKMAKSAGNSITLSVLKEQFISPLAYRYWLLTAHYRSPINFTVEAVQGAQNALMRLMNLVSSLPLDGKISDGYKTRFYDFINDDLDTPKAVALVWDILKDSQLSDADKRATILDFDRVLGLNFAAVQPIVEEVVPPEITVLAEAREEARKEKDWQKADALRKEIEVRGFTVSDTKDGIKVVAK